MSIVSRVRDAQISIEASSGARSFVAIARALAGSRTWGSVARDAEHYRLSERDAQLCQKAAVSPMTFGSNPLTDSGLVAAFSNTLRASSVFDSMLGSMTRVPLNVKIAAVSTGAVGSTPNETQVKLISSLTLASADKLTPRKSVAVLALSDELVRSAAPGAADLFARELRAAVGAATDSVFLPILSSGITPTATAGATAANARTDFAALMAAVSVSANSRLYFLTRPEIAKVLPLLSDQLFRDARWDGGTIAGVPVVPSDAVPSGQIILVDASGIAADSSDIIFDSTSQASLQLDTVPDSPPSASSTITSLWQSNLVALRVERWFGAERLRSNAIAIISGAAYVP